VVVKLVCLFLSLFLASPLLAQKEVAEEAASPWSGKATLGYLATSGNTENSSLNSGFEVAYTSGKWEHILKMRAINSSESEQTTAESYEVAWKTEYNFSETNFMFGRANWRKDRFSGYNTQMSQTAGYGRRLVDTGAHTLNVEVGAGARQSELQDGTSEDDLILRGGLDYKWVFSETADFPQVFVIEAGDINTYFESVSALRARLVGTLALVASYTIKNNSDVPIGTEKTDTFTALSLEYGF
jgi:putative salt-induced outer membrane protein